MPKGRGIRRISTVMIDSINAALDKYLEIKDPIALWEAMRYSVFAGGKRYRPQLLLYACTGLGGAIEDAMPFACALEMIHTYSLIHDDLPSMDNDDIRRGKPTSHKVFGEAMAILAGDGLLNLAYETMADACIERGGSLNALRAMNAVASAAGCLGMIGGQTVDVLSENKIIDESTLLYIHAAKTSALIKASILSGGILAGASPAVKDILSSAGRKLGLAFQIRDDILDLTETTENLGKTALSDLKSNKATYVSVFGFERARRDFEKLSNEAYDELGALNWKDGSLLALARKMHL
jgi:geranylgeranyl diphosphate synthase type II